LLIALEQHYRVTPRTAPKDLGGSSNLNLLVDDGVRKFVARVYRPWVSDERLMDVQGARRRLAEARLPCLPPLTTTDGRAWVRMRAGLLELEPYVENDGRMNTLARIESSLALLGRMHNVLAAVTTSAVSEAPAFVNYVAPEDVVTATSRGVGRLRSWHPTPEEAGLADAAEQLASLVAAAQAQLDTTSIRRQLVHGDFWDNNVLYRQDDVVLVHDFDHMGRRARIDDLALTAYFTFSEPMIELDDRIAAFARMVDAYDSALEDHLTATERAAVPIALARQPLWSVGRWVAELDDEATARAHAGSVGSAVATALEIMQHLDQWQGALE
jgi:homoserine kinase type II